jgi:hypothetical protein
MTYGAERYQGETAGKAVAALVCGIIGLTSCGLVGIAAVILGNQARNEIAMSGGRTQGDGMAQAGLIMGWISIGLLAIGVVVFVIVLVVAASTS